MSLLGPITHLTIHCAATPAGRDVDFATVEAWDIAKFGQKSYHWIVARSGLKHRSLADTVKGAHVGNHNSGNIGVCYIGGMDAKMAHPQDTRTPEQMRALQEIVEEYRARIPGLIVLGHRDWPNVTKACPSFSVKDWMETWA